MTLKEHLKYLMLGIPVVAILAAFITAIVIFVNPIVFVVIMIGIFALFLCYMVGMMISELYKGNI